MSLETQEHHERNIPPPRALLLLEEVFEARDLNQTAGDFDRLRVLDGVSRLLDLSRFMQKAFIDGLGKKWRNDALLVMRK